MHNKGSSNASRHLNKFLVRNKHALAVPITHVMTPLRSRRFSRRRKEVVQPWPVLHLRDWIQVAFRAPFFGHFLLGGRQVQEIGLVEAMLTQFWNRYEFEAGMMPHTPSRTIGLFLHGDEGRGQCKRPILNVAFQPIISWAGENTVNLQKSLVL